MRHDESDSTHFWIYCPGCAYQGKIGVPKNHPAEVVVCPQCREVVSIAPEHRILWQPAGEDEFIEERFGPVDSDGGASDRTAVEPPRETPETPDIAAFFFALTLVLVVVSALCYLAYSIIRPLMAVSSPGIV